MSEQQEHATIWLQPWCANCALHEDRSWCEDNVWEDGCEGCGRQPVKYVTAIDQPKPASSTNAEGAAE